MHIPNWSAFLHDLSRTVLDQDACAQQRYGTVSQIAAEYREAGYLGYPGASEAEIVAAEERLGTRFPEMYRRFLQASNGWAGMSVGSPGNLWPVQQVEWLWVRNQQAVDGWGSAEFDRISPEEHLARREERIPLYRGSYLKSCLEISDWGEGSILLLCPEVVTLEGEWECWHLGSWVPGALRYASFEEWMLEEFRMASQEA